MKFKSKLLLLIFIIIFVNFLNLRSTSNENVIWSSYYFLQLKFVRCDTTKGPFRLNLNNNEPNSNYPKNSVAQLLNMTKIGFFDTKVRHTMIINLIFFDAHLTGAIFSSE